MIKTVDNYYLFSVDIIRKQEDREVFLEKNYYYCLSDKNPEEIHITLEDYKRDKNNFILFESNDSENNLIIFIKKIDDKHIAQTGNYVGRFKYNNVDIEINSRFNDTFLKRMLNFANNIFLDDVDVAGEKSNNLDISKFIIYYLFIQKLEKAFLIGIPKAYKSLYHHETKLKGKIDINRFIKKDIPYKGKISSISREQVEIQEIIDVLHKAVSIIKKDKFNIKNIAHIIPHLNQHKSNKYVSNETINKAQNSNALQNPIFAPYRQVLEYAKMIINNNSLDNKGSYDKSFGFIINIAELFEIYVTKLLRNYFTDWIVENPAIEVYKGLFFQRKIIPDIIMKKDNIVLVFDTKYKKMNFTGKNQYGLGDVDRCDFFQINTYMSYYNNNGYNVKAGGLIYPLEEEYNRDKCYSGNWFGNKNTRFIIDGIELNKIDKDKLIENEKRFIKRIKNLMN